MSKYNDKIYVGWNTIAELLNCSISKARRLYKSDGLPIGRVGRSVSLFLSDLREWSLEQERKKKTPGSEEF